MQIQKSLLLHRIFSKPLYCKVIQLRHSYIVFQLKSIIWCETSFSHIWHMEIHPGVKAKLALTTMDKRLSVYYTEGQDSPLQGSGSLHVGRYYCHEQPMHSNFNTISFLFNYLLLLLLLLLLLSLLLLSPLPLLFIFTITVSIFF